MKFNYNDGGRVEAGFKGTTGDCVTRALAIATGLPYKEVYRTINQYCKKYDPESSARKGVGKKVTRKIFSHYGFEWIPTMTIGSGCKVHLREDELPSGIIVVNLSGHVATVVDGVLNDTCDCSRDGTRCVYGYWRRGKQYE